MRFVKNLIATAALATVVHLGGVAGLPANNLDKRSTIVPGPTTTASIPIHTSPGITTGSNLPSAPISLVEEGGIPSGAVSVWEGSDGHVTLTGLPTRRDEDGMPLFTHTVTESSSAPTDRVSVSPLTIIEPRPGTSADTTVDARQATVDAPLLELMAQVTYLPKPPTGPGGSHPDADVEARQMLPMPSSSTAALSKRQMLPISSSSAAALSKRQMLPISSSSTAALSERQMLPMPSSSSALSARAAETSPGTPFGRQPDINVAVDASAPAAEASPSTPFGRQPNIGVAVDDSAPAAEASPSTPFGRQPNIGLAVDASAPAAEASPSTPFGRQPDIDVLVGGAISTVTETSLHTVTATPSPTSAPSTSTAGVTVTVTETIPAHISTSTTCTEEAPSSVPANETETVTVTKPLSKDSIPWSSSSSITYATTYTTRSVTTMCDRLSCWPITDTTEVTVNPTAGPTVRPTTWAAAAMTQREQQAQASVTLTASYTITITEFPSPITARDQDPTFSVDPSDLPAAITARGQQEAQVSFTTTAPYTITLTESIPIPTLSPTASAAPPPEAGPVDPKPPVTQEVAMPIPPPPPFTGTPFPTKEEVVWPTGSAWIDPAPDALPDTTYVPTDSHTYTHTHTYSSPADPSSTTTSPWPSLPYPTTQTTSSTETPAAGTTQPTGRPHPTTLVTSVVASAA